MSCRLRKILWTNTVTGSAFSADTVGNEAEEDAEAETRTDETAAVEDDKPATSESAGRKSGSQTPKPTHKSRPPQREKTSSSLGSTGAGKSSRMKKQEAEVRRHLSN